MLDNYILENKIKKIDILKIDTEGFEFNILVGLVKNYHIVRYVYFEHHYDDMIIKNYKFKDINNLLLKQGLTKSINPKCILEVI